jgi:hypothetical protein
MGFVPISERTSGLTRRSTKTGGEDTGGQEETAA